jgi:L-alanine-DL-glutamate epimerase-like enolase superfamily enzyme
MKITEVRAVQPLSPGSPPDWRTSLGQILVAIDSDVGLTGYGVGGGGLAGVHVVRTVLRDLLLGRDAGTVEQLWQAMYEATLPFGRKGLAVMALSGADLALWDLRGRAARLPVARLLGGRTDRAIPAYVTVWGAVPPDLVGRYRAFKLHVENRQGGDQAAEVIRLVEEARRAVGRVPASTLRNRENDRGFPPLLALLRLADALGCRSSGSWRKWKTRCRPTGCR